MKFESDPNCSAIVTGTSTGIGEAVARELLEHGWSVIGIARRPSPFAHERYRHVAYDLAEVVEDAAALESQLAVHDMPALSRAPATIPRACHSRPAPGSAPTG